jgi:hypothetical protein
MSPPPPARPLDPVADLAAFAAAHGRLPHLGDAPQSSHSSGQNPCHAQGVSLLLPSTP